LAKKLNEHTGRRLSLKNIFDAPTPAALAAWLGQSQATPAGTFKPPIRARGDQSQAPLSPMQERLWFLASLHPGTPANHLPSAHRLRGPMDAEAFMRAFQRLVDRQPALRTPIERAGREVRQRVAAHLTVRFEPLHDV